MKIDNNIPLPSRGVYPFHKIEIGESFHVQGQDTQGKAAQGARAHGQYHGKKFASRKDGDGVRIWRIA